MQIKDDLYNKIKQVMPIPCVDILVADEENKILLIKRKNEPAINKWWFPGGRVHFHETREHAVDRILYEECGLIAAQKKEIGTYDLFLHLAGGDKISHAITTLYFVYVDNESAQNVKLDNQSSDTRVLPISEWIDLGIDEFVQTGMLLFNQLSMDQHDKRL